MSKAKTIIYEAGFSRISDTANNTPDKYSSTSEHLRPGNNFIISRNKDGTTLSCYQDNIWDLTPYRLSGYTGSTKLLFTALPHSSINEAKWLMFILMYMAESTNSTGLAASTLRGYMKIVKKLAIHASSHSINIFQMLFTESYLTKFTIHLSDKDSVKNLSSLLYHLNDLGHKRTGIKVLGGKSLDHIKKMVSSHNQYNQHPVIPPRIFNTFILELQDYINKIYPKLNDINRFLTKASNSNNYARSHSSQRLLGYTTKTFSPIFVSASKNHNLYTFFSELGISSLHALSKFITRTQHACRIMVHIYSGMRYSEALSLKVGCLTSDVNNSITTYKIHGETSKLIGHNKPVSWITGDAVINAITIAETLALLIGKHIGISSDNTPLFISPSYLGLASRFKYDPLNIRLSKTHYYSQDILNSLCIENLRIKPDDISFLNKIDPFRAWDTEDDFKVGKVWNFTNHQYRRSLAYYALQSSLVSLPTLRQQLKHITNEMTIYYSQAHSLQNEFDKPNHISQMIRKLKPEVDSLAYLHEVILSKETLFGAAGKYIDKNDKADNETTLLYENRKKLTKRFKNGELAYKETPLGACTTLEPCAEKATRSIAACVSCDRTIIKLSKLDNVIEKQSNFVKQLYKHNINSIEYRTENLELDILQSFRNKILKKGKN